MKRNIAASMLATLLINAAAFAQPTPQFNADIRPILSDNCFACHGPDGAHRKAGLRLDDRAAAIEQGAFIPDQPNQSPLIERIQSNDPNHIMPPPETGKTLTESQRRLLTEWIRGGATYEEHWSFQPVPESVTPPETRSDWARNDIDRFVEHKLRSQGLTPNAEADRAAWLRRVTYDLTGLPPTLAELGAFLSDAAPDAYEKAVDRLLASPAYGERMASMWLDLARYADTFGYQNDVAMEVWPWREWVINAFNSNMPYDQFVTEQLAGDLLPNSTTQQKLATTFNRLHRQTNEGGSIPEEFRLTGIADRTTTAGTAFLGLTLDCARCHDHKYDPIKQKDFYRLSAFFSDIDELGLYSHFTFAQPTPAMPLYRGTQQQEHEAALAAVAQAQALHNQAVADAEQHWKQNTDQLISTLPTVRKPVIHLPLDGDRPGVISNATLSDGDNQIVVPDAPEFGRTSPFTYSLWVKPAIEQPRMMLLHQSVAAEDSAFRGIQLTLHNGLPQFSMIHFYPGNALRIESETAVPVDQWSHIVVSHDGSGTAAGLRLFINGRPVATTIIRDTLTRDIRHRSEWGDMNVGDVPTALGARFRDVGFRDGLLDDLQIFNLQLSSAEAASLYHAAQLNTDQTSSAPPAIEPAAAIEHQLLVADESVRESAQRLQQARDHENELYTSVREIMVMRHDPDAPATHLLTRGEYTAKAEAVQPDTPGFLNSFNTNDTAANDSPSNRLTLANWLTHPGNPLTSRVIANRMWHHFFGRGIVVTLEDFGSQGTPPSHPELLDHLASTLIESNWDLKALARHIALSATYRQSSAFNDPAHYQADPQNIFLARGPKRRLSAEQLRDGALAASGLLVQQIGGPSVMPYQPAGLWREAGTGKSYQQSTGSDLYRRSLYTFWKRTAPPPAMLTFDATSRESCTPRREPTTTPLQALVLLNDPQFIEAARALAQQLITSNTANQNARWNQLFRALISRTPTEAERQTINSLYHEQLSYFQQDPNRAAAYLEVGESPVDSSLDPADLAATTVVAQTVLAYDETITLR